MRRGQTLNYGISVPMSYNSSWEQSQTLTDWQSGGRRIQEEGDVGGYTPTDSQAESTEGRTDTNSQPVDSSGSANYLVKSYVHASKFSRDFVFERRCLFREYFGCERKPKEDLCFPIEYSRRIIL